MFRLSSKCVVVEWLWWMCRSENLLHDPNKIYLSSSVLHLTPFNSNGKPRWSTNQLDAISHKNRLPFGFLYTLMAVLEIACFTPQSAVTAAAGGADRIE